MRNFKIDVNTVNDYFNSTEMRIALHVNDKLPYYSFMSPNITENFHSAVEASQFVHHVLKVNGYRMLMIFGATDGSCSLMGTRRWIERNGWVPTQAWTPWTRDGQLKGFSISYDNYTLLTVHGHGHGAIYDLPEISSEIVLDFVNAKTFRRE